MNINNYERKFNNFDEINKDKQRQIFFYFWNSINFCFDKRLILLI